VMALRAAAPGPVEGFLQIRHRSEIY
jgi:hypothetical protein